MLLLPISPMADAADETASTTLPTSSTVELSPGIGAREAATAIFAKTCLVYGGDTTGFERGEGARAFRLARSIANEAAGANPRT